MTPEALERNRQPRRTDARIRQHSRCSLVLANDFAHDALGIRPRRAHITRGSDEAKIAETVLDAAQSAIAAAIKVNLALPIGDGAVLQMRFESNQRRASWSWPVSLWSEAPSLHAASTGGLESQRRAISFHTAVHVYAYASYPIAVAEQANNLRVL